MYVHVGAHQQVTQQQATSISIPRTVTLLLTTGIRNPPGIPWRQRMGTRSRAAVAVAAAGKQLAGRRRRRRWRR